MSTLTRRTILTTAAMAATTAVFASPAAADGGGSTRRPPALSEGDLVMLVSPGGPSDPSDVDKGRAVLESWGLRTRLSEHALDEYGYLSAPDADRLSDLNAAIADPEVRAIMATRGGYGTQRITDDADIAALAADPKLVIGYSDITALHLAVAERAGISSLHAPMAAWDSANTPETEVAFRAAVMSGEEVVLYRDPDESTAEVEVPGRATGWLVGGNLSLLASESRHFPKLHGAILFMEDVDEEPYRVDGMLTELLRAGALEGLAGIAVGQFTDSVGDPGTWTLPEVLLDRLGGLGVPILGGLRVGHGEDPRVLPLGTRATIDTTAGTLTAQAAVE